jgi:glycerate 2-kinase
MHIKNAAQVGTSPASRACVKILNAGLDAVDPERALREAISVQGNVLRIGTFSCYSHQFRRIIVVGAGKASGIMASVVEKILGNRITKGKVIDITARTLKRITVVAGDHPVPSPNNVAHTKSILRMTKGLREDDLVLCLISGGGSALFTDPRIPLAQYLPLTKRLLKSGATIQEFNTVRKHLDGVKGGRFAAHCAPATVVSLLVSDVPGNDPAVIASGPTVHDPTTIRDAQQILAKYSLPQVPVSETPKEAKFFRHVHNQVVIDNTRAVNAMVVEAKKLKLKTIILSTELTGEARDTGKKLLAKLKPRTAVIAAGETTVTVRGTGKGGRNQELVLGSIRELAKMKNTALASIGTDGIDNSPHAGAIADTMTFTRAQQLKLDDKAFLKDNNSFVFWQKLKKAVITGPTGTNVSDVMLAVRL